MVRFISVNMRETKRKISEVRKIVIKNCKYD